MHRFHWTLEYCTSDGQLITEVIYCPYEAYARDYRIKQQGIHTKLTRHQTTK